MGWLPKNCVVVPFDFSEQSDQGLESAQVFVASVAGLHVVHVLPTIELAEPGVIWETIDDDARRRHTEAAFRERFAKTPFEHCRLRRKAPRGPDRHAVPRAHGAEPSLHRFGGGARRPPRALPGAHPQMKRRNERRGQLTLGRLNRSEWRQSRANFCDAHSCDPDHF
jgi:hypothetical protein